MEMFSQGQTAEASLSDEAIFAEPEGQVAEQFQDDHAETTEEAAPAVEETAPEEAAPAGVQAAEAMPVTVPKKTGQTEGVTAAAAIPPVNEKQYREMWRWNTRTATENAALRRQLDEMRREVAQLRRPVAAEPAAQAGMPGAAAGDEQKKEFLRRFLQSPEQTLRPLVERAAEQKAMRAVAPILKREEAVRRSRSWQQAYQENIQNWPQLAEKENQVALVRKMAQLSADDGDRALWQRRPQRYLPAAAMALFGLPVRADQAAIDAAVAAVEQNRREQTQNKAGLTISQQPARRDTQALSPEERIIAEMRSAHIGTMFEKEKE